MRRFYDGRAGCESSKHSSWWSSVFNFSTRAASPAPHPARAANREQTVEGSFVDFTQGAALPHHFERPACQGRSVERHGRGREGIAELCRELVHPRFQSKYLTTHVGRAVSHGALPV